MQKRAKCVYKLNIYLIYMCNATVGGVGIIIGLRSLKLLNSIEKIQLGW